MKRLGKFFRLKQRDRSLLVVALLVLGGIRLGLWLLPFQTLGRLLEKITPKTTKLHEASGNINYIVWAVAVASRYIPGARCLAQALATQLLLSWHGCQTRLCIGVAKDKEGKLTAHAWVENQGKIVMGALENLSTYTPLPLGQRHHSNRWYLFS